MSHGALNSGDASNFYIFRGELGGRYMDPNVYETAESIGYGPDGFTMPRALLVQRSPVYLGHIMVISMSSTGVFSNCAKSPSRYCGTRIMLSLS